LREAIILFEGLVAVDPENAYCRNALAALLLALDEPQRALEQLQVAMRLDSGDMQARQRRCEALLQIGETSAAAEELAFLKSMLPIRETRRLELRLEAAINKA
jgi:predicted Zn-dependent protease